MACTTFLSSGGPGYLLPGPAQRAGSEEPTPLEKLTNLSSRWIASRGLRPPGQQVARAIRIALFGLFLFTTTFASAQTDATNASPTPVPADTAPASPSPAVQPQILPPTLNPAQGSPQSQDEIDDIRPPLFYLHSWAWLWIALAAIALVALLIYLWKWLKPNRLLSAKSAFDLTLEKLDKARDLLKEEDPMPYAVFVSETIRAYLGQRFLTPSTRRTTDEFLRAMESDPHTPLAEHRDLLRNFLQACDLVKFAKYHPTLAELEDVQNRAVTFVTATKPVAPSSQRKGTS